MSRKFIIVLALSTVPSFAAAQESTPTVFSTRDVRLTPAERDALRISREWQERSATGVRPVPGAEGAVVFMFGATEPSIVCAVLQICDVQLQVGEQVNSINIGDSARWLIEPAVSNSGANETQHLIIKPLDVGLSTSLVVTTDRRTYHIKLSSTRHEFMSRVAFQYPDDASAKWAALRARNEITRNEGTIAVTGNDGRPAAEYLSNLNFNYSVKGKARWKPVRVFNDGVKTIIEMPSAMSQTEAPSLLVVRAGGSSTSASDTSIVNYRLQGDRYIVDQIFDEAVLIAGVGSRQDRVTIVREQ